MSTITMLKSAAFVWASALIISALSSCSTTSGLMGAPYGSYVSFRAGYETLKITTCKKIDDALDCVEPSVTSTSNAFVAGGAVAVANSAANKGRQYIATAAHTCIADDMIKEDMSTSVAITSGAEVNDIQGDFIMRVTDDAGRSSIASIVAIDRKHDLCIVAVDDMNLPITKVAHKHVSRGDRVYNLAAPLGMWQPGMLGRYDGVYSGEYACEQGDFTMWNCSIGEPMWDIYSIHAAQGSSGSPILDRHNRIIGIVVMVDSRFSGITLSVRHEDIVKMIEHVMLREHFQVQAENDTD